MRCVLVNTEADFIKMEAALGLGRIIAVDTETNGLDMFWVGFQIVGLSLSIDTQTGYYIPLGHRLAVGKEGDEPPKQLPTQWVMARLDRFLKGRRVSGANYKFDTHVFDRYRTHPGTLVFDTHIAAYVYDSRDCHMGLKDMVFAKLGYKAQDIDSLCKEVKPKEKKHKNKKRNSIGFEYLTPEQALPYAAADAVNVQRLHRYYSPRIMADKGLSRILALEIQVHPVIKRMEQCGILIDQDKLRDLHDKLKEQEIQFNKKLADTAGESINPRSPSQVGDLFYHRMRLPVPDGQSLYPKGKAPPQGWLDKNALKDLLVKVTNANQDYFGDPRVKQWTKADVVDLLKDKIRVGKLTKLRTTYTVSLIDLLGDDNRLHTDYRQLVETGRLASGSPNLTNIPRGDDKDVKGFDIRAAFVSDPGYVFVKADYQAQEVRMLAAMSGDPTLRDIFTGVKLGDDGKEMDIHAYVASIAFEASYIDIINAIAKKKREEILTDEEAKLVGFRQAAKPTTFGIAYGITPIGLAIQIGRSQEFAAFLIDAWKTKVFPVAARWLELTPEYARQNLYVETYMGRKRRISVAALALSKWQFESRVAKQLANAPIQGGSADMTKAAMIRVDNALQAELGDDKARLCCMIHDELVVLCEEAYAKQAAAILEREMADNINGIPFPATAAISTTLSKE